MFAIKTVALTKKFGEFIANDNISINVEKGKILAIVGENGAGKTTLMNMLYGLLKPTSGEIYVNDEKVDFRSPADAIKHGIGMVHQHFKLVPSLTVYENIFLGNEDVFELDIKYRKDKVFKLKTGFIKKKEEKEKIKNLIEENNFNIDPSKKVKDLTVGAKQKVEILKMLQRNADILIFDEPTAVLIPQEIEEFFENVKKIKEKGKTIIIITHKLKEVMEISDNVYVIKQGKIIDYLKTSNTSEAEIANLMVGRSVLLKVDKKYRDLSNEKVIYRVQNLSTKDKDGKTVVDNVSFEIKSGEILGVAGVEGNGQTPLAHLLTGMMSPTSGDIYYKDQRITSFWPKELRKIGLGIIPEDRYLYGLCEEMSITNNLIASSLDDENICKRGIFQTKEIDRHCDNLIDKYDIRLSEKKGNISSLSGGNAQKIIIARELEKRPDVLICSQPTRGIDIGAIEFIHNSLLNYSKNGKAILLISSEISEIMSLSDRIIVMYKGKIIGEVDAKNTTLEELGLLMGGVGFGSQTE